MELTVFMPTASYFAHTLPFFAERVRQVPEYAEASSQTARDQLVWLDEVLGRTRYVAGSSYTIADMTALIAVDLGIPSVYEIGPHLENLGRWWSEVSARPASRALAGC